MRSCLSSLLVNALDAFAKGRVPWLSLFLGEPVASVGLSNCENSVLASQIAI
jgi:hypothetical protein